MEMDKDSPVFKSFWSSKRKRSSSDEQPNIQRPSESREMTVEVDLSSTLLLSKVTFDFIAGSSIGLPTNWRFFLTTTEVNDIEYLGIYLRLHPPAVSANQIQPAVESEGQIQQNQKKIFAKFSVELFTTDPCDKSSKKIDGDEYGYTTSDASGYGVTDFVPIRDLFRYDFDGKLKLYIQFTMFGYDECSRLTPSKGGEEPMAKKQKTHQEVSIGMWQSQIYNELLDGTTSDLIVRTSDGKEVNTHRFVMAARSNYFKNEIKKAKQFGDKYLLEVDIPHEIMKRIICHIVTGNLPTYLFDSKNKDMELLKALNEAAIGYELDDLRDYLESHPAFVYEMN